MFESPAYAKNQYIITGTDAKGKRFSPIRTLNPRCYNIYRGTVWLLKDNGKRKKLYEVFN